MLLKFALGIVTPWGEDLWVAPVRCSWEQGFVARATRVCRRCDRVALRYSPPHTIVWGTPIISRYRGYLEVITPDSDARREQRTNSFVHCRAEELGCLHPNRDYRPRRVLRANAFAHSRADAGGDEVATRLCGSSPATPTSTTKTCSRPWLAMLKWL